MLVLHLSMFALCLWWLQGNMHFYTFYKIYIRRVAAKSNELRRLISKTWIASVVPLKSSLQKPPGLIIINALQQLGQAKKHSTAFLFYLFHIKSGNIPKEDTVKKTLINSRRISYFESYLCLSLDGRNAISLPPKPWNNRRSREPSNLLVFFSYGWLHNRAPATKTTF